jgi:hypothetical protein
MTSADVSDVVYKLISDINKGFQKRKRGKGHFLFQGFQNLV